MPGDSGIELVVHEALTSLTVEAFCRGVEARLARAPAHLWLDLEDVKVADVVGLGALLQAVRRCDARGVRVSVLPSPALYRAFLAAGILEELPLERPGIGPTAPAEMAPFEAREAPRRPLAQTPLLGVRPPAWEELPLFERWAHDPLLDQMVGSRLLYVCRHLGPFHPDFVARALHDPTALTLVVEPREAGGEPVGFVRLFNVNLLEGFAFLETGIVHPRSLRGGWGVEASRLVLAWAMDALEIRRVEAKAYAYNVLSINALRRNGFRQEGVLREAKAYGGQAWDILVFAMLEPEMRRERLREGFPPMGLWRTDAGP